MAGQSAILTYLVQPQISREERRARRGNEKEKPDSGGDFLARRLVKLLLLSALISRFEDPLN